VFFLLLGQLGESGVEWVIGCEHRFLPLPVNASALGAELGSGRGVPPSGEVCFRVGISFILPDRAAAGGLNSLPVRVADLRIPPGDVPVDDKGACRARGIGDSSSIGFHARIPALEKLETGSGSLDDPEGH
jgi:hypothetical protein